jgi:hypothetical protein
VFPLLAASIFTGAGCGMARLELGMAKTTLVKTAAAMASVLKLITVMWSSSVILRRSVNAGLGEKVPPTSDVMTAPH